MIALHTLFDFVFHLSPIRPPRPGQPRHPQDIVASEHLLRDMGLDGQVSPADDPRWQRRLDLER